MPSSRRKFLQGTSMLAAASLAGSGAAVAEPPAGSGPPRTPPLQTPPSVRRGDMLYRKLGSTGVEVSLLGLGGFHIATQKNPDDSTRLIRHAIDQGVTFLDNSWDYHDGK